MSIHVRSGLSRLGLLLAVVALAVVVPVLTGAPRAAAAQASCTGNAMIFDARNNGQLWLYVNTAPATGASSWSTVEQIGAGFNGLVKAGPNGDIYYITTAGLLRLYHFTGTGWTNAAGVTIGSGWSEHPSTKATPPGTPDICRAPWNAEKAGSDSSSILVERERTSSCGADATCLLTPSDRSNATASSVAGNKDLKARMLSPLHYGIVMLTLSCGVPLKFPLLMLTVVERV